MSTRDIAFYIRLKVPMIARNALYLTRRIDVQLTELCVHLTQLIQLEGPMFARSIALYIRLEEPMFTRDVPIYCDT